MKLEIFITNDNRQIVKKFTCITDSIPRALQMYEDEAGETQHMVYRIVEEKPKTSRENGKKGGRPKK